jgi:hypothetical protein
VKKVRFIIFRPWARRRILASVDWGFYLLFMVVGAIGTAFIYFGMILGEIIFGKDSTLLILGTTITQAVLYSIFVYWWIGWQFERKLVRMSEQLDPHYATLSRMEISQIIQRLIRTSGRNKQAALCLVWLVGRIKQRPRRIKFGRKKSKGPRVFGLTEFGNVSIDTQTTHNAPGIPPNENEWTERLNELKITRYGWNVCLKIFGKSDLACLAMHDNSELGHVVVLHSWRVLPLNFGVLFYRRKYDPTTRKTTISIMGEIISGRRRGEIVSIEKFRYSTRVK